MVHSIISQSTFQIKTMRTELFAISSSAYGYTNILFTAWIYITHPIITTNIDVNAFIAISIGYLVGQCLVFVEKIKMCLLLFKLNKILYICFIKMSINIKN